ncbi:metacaspase-1-like, partial [Juglans microcarpa x Juglans regia]|uniref:metacaspase-1-like n=1 Tax=Juglans microcarpa x Juglans regia TaxID=2249226 RepID=UPI001B7E6D65
LGGDHDCKLVECTNAVTRISTSSSGCSHLGWHFIQSVLYSKPDLQTSRNVSKEFQKNKQKSSSSSSGISTTAASQSYSSSLDIKPSPSVSSAEAPRGRPKRALLCGVTHRNKTYSLSGTINDVRDMKNLLIQHFGYPRECIRILTEEDEGSDFTPTKKNIQDSLKWLVEGSESGDLLVFYYSGHGLRQPDVTNEELDGFDETICPVDFMQEGMILDNEIHSTIVRPLKEGVTLHAIVDACHSGTILDLDYTYDLQRKDWESNRPPSKLADKSSASGTGLAICLSACGDDQMTSDTNAFSKKEMNGAMTSILIQMVGKDSEITYEVLLDKMHDFIQQVNNKSMILNSRFLQRIFHRKKLEDPLLSSSQKFEVSLKKFLQ